MDKPSFCVALKCSLCCYFTNHKTTEKDGFTVSAEYDRPINTSLNMTQEFFEAGAQEKNLNEEPEAFSREQYSPCLLLDKQGLCSGHDCASNKGDVKLSDGKAYDYARLNEIYKKGIPTEGQEIEAFCPEYTCDFRDKYERFVHDNSELILKRVTVKETLKARFDALKEVASENGFVPATPKELVEVIKTVDDAISTSTEAVKNVEESFVPLSAVETVAENGLTPVQSEAVNVVEEIGVLQLIGEKIVEAASLASIEAAEKEKA